jgi:hypothetical protein
MMSDGGRRSVFSLAGRVVMFEFRLYMSLARWLVRRPAVPRDVESFGYSQVVAPVMWLWIFASAAEMVVAHLLIPWPTIRIVVLVISVWGLIWMIGFLASIKVHPHLVGADALRVRHGSSVDIAVPWELIASIVAQRRDLPSSIRTLRFDETKNGAALQVAVSDQVNVRVALNDSLTVPTRKGDRAITELSFWADDPNTLVRRAREHLVAGVARQDQGRV